MSTKAKTQTELRESRLKWAAKLDELQSMSVGDLRGIATEIEVGRIERGSDSVTVNYARKPELINAISEICKEQKKMSLAIENRVDEIDDVVEREADYAAEIDRNEALGDLIKQTWARLDKYIDSRWKPKGQFYDSDNGKILDIVSIVTTTVDSWISKKPPYAPLTPFTKMRMKRDVGLTIKDKIVPELKGTMPDKKYDECVRLAGYFHQQIKFATRQIQSDKRKDNKLREEKEHTNVSHLKVARLLEWADGILNRLDEGVETFNPRNHWREVVVALLVVTGRRQSEITSSAKFEKVSDTSVLFKGQLKAQTRDIKEKGFVIPVLTSPEKIIKGIEWLESAGKRDPDHNIAHNKFSTYISEEAKDVMSDYVEFVLEPENPDDRLERKPHLFRAIHTVICVNRYMPANYRDIRYAQEILGEKDAMTGDTYLRKCRILDA